MAARLLANELRRLRMAAGLSQADVAGELGCAPARVGHLETRRNQVRRSDLLVMLQLYKVPVERQVWYLDLAVKAKEKGWWDRASGVPEWFSAFIGLEWGASAIRVFELTLIPGLLQTRSYMEALFRARPDRADEEIQGYIDQRVQRQKALHRQQEPLALHAILDEAALRRIVGGVAIMRGQLTHLVDMSEHPHVTLQVMPFDKGAVLGLESGFHMLRFGEHESGVVYLDTLLGGLYLEEENEVTAYDTLFEEHASVALTEADSVGVIKQLVKDLS